MVYMTEHPPLHGAQRPQNSAPAANRRDVTMNPRTTLCQPKNVYIFSEAVKNDKKNTLIF